MKVGDIVRFKPPYYLKVADVTPSAFDSFAIEGEDDKKVVGLLVEYESWEKMVEILYEGKVYRIQPRHVEKAGKKDQL